MTPRDSRRGYTLIEVLVVMAILVLLATILVPTIAAFRMDTRARAGADVIRSEFATARAHAKDEGRPYRIAISEDGKRIRREPVDSDPGQSSPSQAADGNATAVEYPFDSAIATMVAEEDVEPTANDGWVTVATVMPDGTCRETNILVSVADADGSMTVYLRIRGLTGRTSVTNTNPNTTSAGAGTNTDNTDSNGGKP